MKRMIAMLFVVVMILSCVPVMAVTVPDGGAVTAAAKKKSSSSKTGWRKKGSKYRYYYTKKKYYKKQIRAIGGRLYAFDKKGYVQRGWVTLNNKKYYASYNEGAAPMKYGALLTGWRNIGGAYYYLNPSGGAMVTGLVKIGNYYYYFDPGTGKQVRTANATVTANGNIYKVLANTSLQYVRKAPAAATASVGKDMYGMDAKAQKYSSKTRYLILVNKGRHSINVYQGSKGKWTCVRRDMRCTIGKKSTPSPSGSFVLDHKSHKAYGYKDFTGSTAFYATRISAGNYFHSILFKKGSRNPATAKLRDGSLGKSKSNSCIRLAVENAKYIWKVTPTKTRVVVY